MIPAIPALPWHNPALPAPACCIPYGLAEAVAAAYARTLSTTKRTLHAWAVQQEISYQLLLTLRTVGHLNQPAPAELTPLLHAFGHPLHPLLLTQPGYPPDLLFYVEDRQHAYEFDLATAALLPVHLAGAYDCTALREQALSDTYRRANRSAFLYFLETGNYDRLNGRYEVPTTLPAVLPDCTDTGVLELEREAVEQVQVATDAFNEAQGALNLLAATLVVNRVSRPLPTSPALDVAGLEKWLDYIRRLSPPPRPLITKINAAASLPCPRGQTAPHLLLLRPEPGNAAAARKLRTLLL